MKYTEHQLEQRRAAHRRWMERNPGKRAEYYKGYDASRPVDEKLYKSSKDRARLGEIPHDIKPEDITVPENCPICDVVMSPAIGSRGGSPSSPTLDKIIPEKGYVKGNIAVICKLCNSTKGSGSSDLHRKIADYIDKHRVN